MQIHVGYENDKRVIPVLVGGASMPRADALPEAIRPLARRNAVGLRPDRFKALKAAVGLHFAHYNFVRLHRSLRTTPAMAAGISDRLWTLEELVEQTSR